MKNIFTAMLFCLFSAMVVGQSKSSQENTRVILASAMVSFVDSVKPAYTAHMSYEAFQNLLTGNARPTTEGATLIRQAHDFLSKKYSNQAILDSYSGLEIAVAYLKLKSLNDGKKTTSSEDLFSSTTGNFNPYQNKKPRPESCYWYEMTCHIGNNDALTQFGCYVAMITGKQCN